MKAYIIMAAGVLLAFAGCTNSKVSVTFDPNGALVEIDWPMPQKWQEAYGKSAQSQRDYNVYLLGRLAKQQKLINQKFADALDAIDPNLMTDPNE